MNDYREPGKTGKLFLPKLYEIPDESKIYCDVSDGSTFIIFHHIDGSFSLCTSEKGNTVHLYVSSILRRDGDNYRLLTQKEIEVYE